MTVQLTWIPDNGIPETLTADIPEPLLSQMRSLIGMREWATSEAVMWLPCRTLPSGPMTKRLFRLARITALDPGNQP